MPRLEPHQQVPVPEPTDFTEPAQTSAGRERLDLLLEAERRGLPIPDDQMRLLTEARRRGLVTQQAPTQQEEASLGDALQRQAHIALGGFNRGVTNLGELLIDPVPMAISRGAQALGADIDDVRPVNSLAGLMEEVGSFGPEPQTTGERFIRRIGEEVGAAAIPQAALTRTGQLARAVPSLLSRQGARQRQAMDVTEGEALGNFLTRVTDTIRRSPETVSRFVQEPFRQAPVRANLIESAGAAGAGVGGQAAIEAGAERGSAPEVISAIAGGVASGIPIAGAKVATGAARRLPGLGSGASNSPRVRQEVGDILMQNLTDAPQAELNMIRQANRTPEVGFTTAQATGDPGLSALEVHRAREPASAGRFSERRRQQQQFFRREFDDAAPAGDPRATQQELERRRQQALDTARGRVGTQEQARDEALAQAEPTQTAQQAGRRIREDIGDELAQARQAERQAWQSITPEGQTIEVDAAPIQQRAQAIMDETPQAQREQIPELVDRVAQGDEALLRGQDSLENVAAFRSRIRQEIAEERGQTVPDRNKIRQLTELADEVETTLRGTGERLSDPTAAQRFEEATQISRELNDRFSRGAVARTQATGRDRAPRVADSDVASEFFRGRRAEPERIDQFVNAVGGRPQAAQALRDAAVEDAGVRNIVKENGQVDTARLGRWLNSNESVVNAFPEIRRDLGSIQRAEHTLRSARKRQEMLEKGLNTPTQSTIAKFLAPEEAREGMSRILRSQQPVREAQNLMKLVRRDEDAVEGARRAFFDLMEQGRPGTANRGVRVEAEGPQAGETVMLYRRLRDFLNENDQVARTIFQGDTEHLKRLRQISEDMQRAASTEPGAVSRAAGGGIVERSAPAATTIPAIQSRLFAVKRGVVSPLYATIDVTARVARRSFFFYRQKHVEQLLDDALLDPELSRTLMLEATDQKRRVLARRLRLYLINQIPDGDEQEQEMSEDQIPEDATIITPEALILPDALQNESQGRNDGS